MRGAKTLRGPRPTRPTKTLRGWWSRAQLGWPSGPRLLLLLLLLVEPGWWHGWRRPSHGCPWGEGWWAGGTKWWHARRRLRRRLLWRLLPRALLLRMHWRLWAWPGHWRLLLQVWQMRGHAALLLLRWHLHVRHVGRWLARLQLSGSLLLLLWGWRGWWGRGWRHPRTLLPTLLLLLPFLPGWGWWRRPLTDACCTTTTTN